MKLVVLAAAVLYFVCTVTANPVIPSTVENSLGVISQADADFCPPGFQQPANSNWTNCYKVLTNFKSVMSARTQCHSLNGTLASIGNSFVNSFMYYLATQNSATSIWLGLECYNGDDSNCVNDDGTPYTFKNLYPGQPNVDGNCVYMSTLGRESQKWLSFDCDQQFQFACEVPSTVGLPPKTTPVPPPTTPNPNLKCPQGYAYFQGTCYTKNYVYGGNTRSDEVAACEKIPGGFMATIASDAVENFVENLYCKNPFVRFGLTCSNVRYDGDTSSCVWDDRQPFKYHKFAPQYPRANSNPCIYEYEGAWMNDGTEKCTDAFICSACQAPAH